LILDRPGSETRSRVSFVAAVVGGIQPVPESSTLLLAILALCVVGGWRWSG
jgi:hypothetical protein